VKNYSINSIGAGMANLTTESKHDYVSQALDLHSDMVYRLAFSHMRNEHDAKDIYQDVFLRLISKPRSFKDAEHLKAWLIRTTINRCRSVYTSAWFRKTMPFDESLAESLVFEAREENDLFEYLSLLSGKYRSVIHLFYCEEMSISQIARVMKARESTVRTWLTRARAILREKLQSKGDCFNE
jgi:RNA polymerase sigma-70 factor (ECF subfamily)